MSFGHVVLVEVADEANAQAAAAAVEFTSADFGWSRSPGDGGFLFPSAAQAARRLARDRVKPFFAHRCLGA